MAGQEKASEWGGPAPRTTLASSEHSHDLWGLMVVVPFTVVCVPCSPLYTPLAHRTTACIHQRQSPSHDNPPVKSRDGNR